MEKEFVIPIIIIMRIFIYIKKSNKREKTTKNQTSTTTRVLQILAATDCHSLQGKPEQMIQRVRNAALELREATRTRTAWRRKSCGVCLRISYRFLRQHVDPCQLRRKNKTGEEQRQKLNTPAVLGSWTFASAEWGGGVRREKEGARWLFSDLIKLQKNLSENYCNQNFASVAKSPFLSDPSYSLRWKIIPVSYTHLTLPTSDGV